MRAFWKGMGIAAAIMLGLGGMAYVAREAYRTMPAVDSRPAAARSAAASAAPGSIPEGTWTVGRDIEPGTYRVAGTVASGAGCYWAIYKTGTNKTDVVQSDIPAGGRPTVTLAIGQDFVSDNCGSWVKE